ncbi:MAG: protein-export membrane protein SecF [Candidatus Yanofskybacteria bacterium RIFCSPHIGHO2_01_FULL_39_8b]|uniref:Protein-export membrane protein SecF n=1 Tax=Candidatus Yanofskybacteria bacterium RIFCSPHIGHO2_01_FULL_39_8b TaxID=1802659 RepID=A0A1F8E863_9BACT|nr:MAG: protein-export membrane protein SecF [Candidatus Yanofskybacteria bacterium RIFCSPHIGHO2_01_FULL_39_8b]
MFFVSVALTVIAVVAFAVFGLNLGVDFRGGSILELEFTNGTPVAADIQVFLRDKFSDNNINVSEVGDDQIILRSGEISEQGHQGMLKSLREKYSSITLEEKRFDSLGPIIGQELKDKSIKAVFAALLVIVIYIAFVFRKMSVILSSWTMSVAAMIALAHDVIIPIGVFAVLGRFYNVEISAVFVAALLTILGYSVSDTVVVFDRVRENVIRNRLREDFEVVVHKSIMQTLARSLNTTLTTLLSLVAIYLFGGESLRYFALALIIGIFLGAYSSIFVASPILVYWSRWAKKK